ncbi:MAG: GTP cyclohydrolase II [Alphaproteobacteria bacterium]
MKTSFSLLATPVGTPPASLVAVDRAVAELRRGGMVVVIGERAGEFVVIQAAEAATPASLAALVTLVGEPPSLALSSRRAAVLGFAPAGSAGATTVVVSVGTGLDTETVLALAQPAVGPVRTPPEDATAVAVSAPSADDAAVRLAKLARLLPAALVASILTGDIDSWARRRDLPTVRESDIRSYDHTSAGTLRAVSEARVPLAQAVDTRIVAFRPADGGTEHLAIIIGSPDGTDPVLVRIHSECFTGDLLGSLRCDCGDQLRGAIGEIAQTGSGVLLYLAQEGRGIGLVNKLRAYQLQDVGFDTLDANNQLGFDEDERVYLPAAGMLGLLGISRVRLLTNNPRKVEALARHGVDVVERVPHVFPANDHNRFYLHTKSSKGGHLF